MEDNPTEPIHFLNLEYFFRLLYETVIGANADLGGFGGVMSFLSGVWTVVIVIAYILSLIALLTLIFTIIRTKQILEDEHHLYTMLTPEEAERKTDASRWSHILALIESPHESDWRQAIIEADIMLEEVLVEKQYAGETTKERLEKADPTTFKTLTHAREAHHVRNELAHFGSGYKLDDNLAYRTIKNYEVVFLEFGEIGEGIQPQRIETHEEAQEHQAVHA